MSVFLCGMSDVLVENSAVVGGGKRTLQPEIPPAWSVHVPEEVCCSTLTLRLRRRGGTVGACPFRGGYP